MSEVTIQVNRSFLCNLNNILTDSRENTSELATYHEEARGRTTKSNKLIGEMYDKELEELDRMIIDIRSLINS